MPNAFEGQLRITNYEWDAKLRDAQSDVFTSLASTLEEDLRVLLSPLTDTQDTLAVRVTSFAEGSVIVLYSFGWDLPDRDSSLTSASIRNTISNQLKNENGMLFGKFAVDKQSIDVGYTMDKCSTMECSGSCTFSYSQNSFVCSALTSTEKPLLSASSAPTSPSSTTSTTSTSTSTTSTTTSTSTTTTTTAEDNKDMLLPQLEVNPEPKSEPEPESEPEAESEPEPENEPEPETQPEPESEPEPETLPEPEPETEPESSNGKETEAEPESEPTPQTMSDIDISLVAEPEPETTPKTDGKAEETTITIKGSDIVTEEPLPAETTTDEASLTTLISSEEVSAKVEVTERPAAGSEEVSETIEVVTQLPAGLVPQTTEAAVGDAVTEFEEDQITTDSPHSVTSVAESGPIETLEKAVKPVNLPAAAENPVETGNTFTTVANPPRETESATEAVVNILPDVNGDDDAAATVSTETTMDTTISSENIAVEGGEKSDVIQGGSGGESKLVDLVTGSNLGQVSTTLTPPQEQPVTFFPSEEEEGTTDQINNVIADSDTPSSELLSEELVIASNEIPDAAAPKLDESDASESLGEVESVTELVTVESETKKSSRREGGRSQALQAADSQNLIQFVDEKSTNIENLNQEVSKKEETTHSPASPTDKLSNKRIIFPDDADDQPFEITFSTQLPVEATTSGVVIEASNTSTLSAENDPIDCISGLVCGGRCLATHQVCDSLVDCENGEDEAECGFPSCREDEFSCLKGRCIPDAWKCDGKPDCSAGEDEVI